MIIRIFLVAIILAFLVPASAKKSPGRQTTSYVYDVSAQQALVQDNSDRLISIASMTKLIAVMTVLAAEQNLSELLTVARSRDNSPRLRSGMKISRLDLISLAMISSDNLATKTLLEHYPGGYAAGLAAMNDLVKRLGAENTVLVEPTGVMAANVSTARDLAIIARSAATNPLFAILANQQQAQVSVERTSRTRRIVEWIIGRNTNPFLEHAVDFRTLLAKTGYTQAAGYCLVMVVEFGQHRFVVITAGHASKKHRKQRADELLGEITRRGYQIRIDKDYDDDDAK